MSFLVAVLMLQDVLHALRSVLPTVWTTTAYCKYTSAADTELPSNIDRGATDMRGYGVPDATTTANTNTPQSNTPQRPEIDNDEGFDDEDEDEDDNE